MRINQISIQHAIHITFEYVLKYIHHHLYQERGYAMIQEKMWQELTTLPPTARQQVFDFIAFLRLRYPETPSYAAKNQTTLRDEPFVGIWRDHAPMSDSSAWVRESRLHEWG